jgi:hypothetical protein
VIKDKLFPREYDSEEAEVLAEHGIVMIPGYLDEDECDRIKADIENVIETAREGDDEDIILNETGERVPDVDEKTIVDVRGSADDESTQDDGMLDIRDLTHALPSLEEIRDDPYIAEIVADASGIEYDPELRTYVNRSVVNTRGYHADKTSYSPSFKAFIYLTDVPDDSYGPYSYVPGSHQSVLLRYLNNVYNAVTGNKTTEMPLFFSEKARNMTASKGTLIISNQHGVHRGIPQEAGKERFVLVNSYINFAD